MKPAFNLSIACSVSYSTVERMEGGTFHYGPLDLSQKDKQGQRKVITPK